MEEKKFWICANLSGLGPVRLKKLLDMQGSIEKVFQLSFTQLREAGVPQKVAKKMAEWRELPWQEEIAFCKKNNIRIVTVQDGEYPFLLKQIYDPPYILHVKGFLHAADNTLAIVGTRNPSFYGLKMAEKFAMELAYYGFTIVSGLARGIDAAAHRGALKGEGRTIGVLGSGFNHFYPYDNLNLANEIKEQGAVVTEFPFSARPEPQHFPLRNRIVAGMSQGTLVIEAGQKSGALITANLAADQGREVFALPGQVDNIFSKGVNQLLKEGAALVEDVQDIFDNLNISIRHNCSKQQETGENLTAGEKRIIEAIGSGKMHIEELASVTKTSCAELSNLLVNLLLKKLIVELPGKIYAKK